MIKKHVFFIMILAVVFLLSGCITKEEQKEKSTVKNAPVKERQYLTITVEDPQSVREKELTRMQITGKIQAVIQAEDKQIEHVIQALQFDKKLNITWSHSPDGKNHHFLINNVTRAKLPSSVQILWDGKSVHAEQKGKKEFEIPSLETFIPVSAKSIDDGEQGIQVTFSDPLNLYQNLNGLIRVDEKNGLKFEISGNTIRVYSKSPFSRQHVLSVEPGIKNAAGYQLEHQKKFNIDFEERLPQVRFVGKGSIVPAVGLMGPKISIPIEAINLKAVVVEALAIKDDNLPQFFQVNDFDSDEELRRVGRVVWRKTIDLVSDENKPNQWLRYGLDLTPLMQKNQAGMFRLRLSFRHEHILYPCPVLSDKFKDHENSLETPLSDLNADDEIEPSNWDSFPDNYNWSEYYSQKKNPCHPSYYMVWGQHDISASKNIIISDIGLVAKAGDDNTFFIAATNLNSTRPEEKVVLELLNYQQDVVASGVTDEQGMAKIICPKKPFLIVAKKNSHKGYLKVDDGSSLSVSHFDAGGKKSKKGLKGFIYGERGVWRPGDDIYLTFILFDEQKKIPKDHPIKMELINPKGQIIKTVTVKESKNGFYCFKTRTGPDAPTGNWRVKIHVGGAVFEKRLKIEMVKPNRLKIGFNLDYNLPEVDALTYGDVFGTLSSEWLHGAIAKNLKADVELALTSAQTGFPGYEPFCFDDPVRSFGSEAQSVFNGTLNDKGISKFHTSVLKSSASPGMLTANFRTRVFEPGGGFSIDHFNIPFHPYNRYVGVKLPEGDKARGMLLTDTDHITDIVMVNEKGMPVPFGKAAIEIYKIKWRWWWEKGSEVIADYVGTSSYQKVSEGIVDIVNGRAQWHFMIKYPSWGRYLIRVTDVSDQGSSIEKDTHIAGKIFYADWPGWAGRGGKESPEGASVLNFSSDKETYRVGEDVTLTIPAALTGRALVSLESGSNILLAQWIEAKNQDIKFTFTATPQMAPNIYAAVTLVQPYSHPGNDLPVRRYGVIPIPIVNPDSRLKPVIQCSDEFKPETDVTIKILEQSGEPMTYTLAVVDDGLLGLTRFATPDPWEDFYAKQALGIKTWDLFDSVAGAYGGALEKILAIGGDDAFGTKGKKRSNRFPPMVRFIGPFELAPNGVNAHTLSIPQYIGQVRVMAVAGHEEAFGSAQKEVKVKAPLMVQGTLPRVVATLETVDLPISVFCLDDQIKTVKVIVKPMGRIAVENEDQMSLVFKEIGDKIISFKIKAGSTPGPAGIIIEAFSGSIRATQRIDFNIRSPLVRQVQTLDPGPFKAGKLRTQIDLPGIPGTAKALLEVSRIPPINLGKRLDSLIQYPHGCAEQVISQLFPQLFLKSFLSLSLEKEKEIEQNIKAGIDRIIAFQKIDGGFAYWPLNDEADPFVTSYAGHFLLLAEKLGYLISGNVLTQWKHWQAKQAHAWMTGHKSGELMQAYRLFTLAVANDVQLGAMNRLRESGHLSDVAKTRLAAAYQLAGQPEAAFDLTQDISMEMDEYLAPGSTYGNEIRDKAMILESLLIVNKKQALGPIMDEISEILASDKWLSTQSTAYCLIAMAQAYDLLNENQVTSFSYAWNKNQMIHMESKAPVVQILLPQTKDNRATLVMAAAPEQPIFLRIMVDSIPLMGQQESSASGIFMTVAYSTLNGLAIDPEILTHGTDLTARVSIKNIGTTGTYKDLALTYRVPSGWEIINKRLDFLDAKNSKFDHLDFRDDRVNTYFDLKPGQTKTFSLELNASYLGRFFLPATIVEAMYDASINAVEKGRWVNIVKDTTRQ